MPSRRPGREADASDLVQETLVRIYQNFGQFAGKGVPELLGWVGQIAANAVVSWERHRGAEKRDHRREAVDMQFLAGAVSTHASARSFRTIQY